MPNKPAMATPDRGLVKNRFRWFNPFNLARSAAIARRRAMPLTLCRRMILSSITYEPWESVHMWFLAPGLFVWIGAAIWWARSKTIWLPLVVQLVGGFGVAVGGIAAYMAGVASSRAGMIEAGFWDPSVDAGNEAFVAEIAVIAWGVHWALLTGTLIMTIATNTRKTKMPNKSRLDNPLPRPESEIES